ncbi:MAG: leucyl aminopeptidase [Burkholderiales bacterium]|nr:leucyl aminopeptidase [Burkholderiales bacterium]
MEFSTKALSPERITAGCIAVGVFESRRLSTAAAALDRVARGHLRDFVKRGDMDGRAGAVRLLYRVPHLRCERVLLVGLGRESDFGAKQYRDAVRTAVTAVADTGARDVCLCLPELHVAGRDLEWKMRHAAIVAAEALYRFEETKSKKSPARKLRSMAFAAPARGAAAERGLAQGRAIAAGMSLARDLGNLPSNICTPTYLAAEARRLARQWRLGVEVLDSRDMQRLGMGALLAVAKGSRQPPKFIVLRYNGAGRGTRPVVLVGKGITFDTGGISLKPAAEMDEMKYDMCGAASVLGTLRAAAEMKLAVNVVGLVPATENMPGGAATKPGDVVTTMSGQTVEILNTDAEGRLILCDALTYAGRFKPQAVVDIATLTGACVIALGHVATGLFANRDTLAEELAEAGADAWDRAWRMPLWDDYQEQIKSPFADIANIGGRPAGSVTAACFLSRFADKFDWAHLDIAGTAWVSGKNKGATGRPVPMLATFLLGRSAR